MSADQSRGCEHKWAYTWLGGRNLRYLVCVICGFRKPA